LCAVEGGVGILQIEVQGYAGATAAFEQERVRRHFAAEHEDRIADAELGVHHGFAIRCHEP